MIGAESSIYSGVSAIISGNVKIPAWHMLDQTRYMAGSRLSPW